MDFSLAAKKLFLAHIARCRVHRRPPKPPVAALGSLLFQRVWVQGVVVSHSQPDPATSALGSAGQRTSTGAPSTEARIVLDDGTATLEVALKRDSPAPPLGAYVLVIGALVMPTSGPPFIKEHKLVDLSNDPNREALWWLEVTEAHNKFYFKQDETMS